MAKLPLPKRSPLNLAVPLLSVRYESVIASYLGETAVRFSRLFDQVRVRRCVLFFDEFDVVGKERGDVHETGEIKRVVSSLLLQIDSLPSHVVAVSATNHPELLDRAVWRRFQLQLTLPPPTPALAQEWFRRFEQRFGSRLGFGTIDPRQASLRPEFRRVGAVWSRYAAELRAGVAGRRCAHYRRRAAEAMAEARTGRTRVAAGRRRCLNVRS